MNRNVIVVALLIIITGWQSNQSALALSPEKFTTAPGKPNQKAGVIVPGSVISITVAQDRTLNRAFTVPDSGVVNFQPLGRVAVEGLTREELAGQIRKALEKDYFPKATVTVTIESSPGEGGVIYVVGNVNRPGPLVLPKDKPLTIAKAINAAGSLSASANAEKIQLVRYDTAGKKRVTYINLKRGEPEKDVPVQNGDWIIVP